MIRRKKGETPSGGRLHLHINPAVQDRLKMHCCAKQITLSIWIERAACYCLDNKIALDHEVIT